MHFIYIIHTCERQTENLLKTLYTHIQFRFSYLMCSYTLFNTFVFRRLNFVLRSLFHIIFGVEFFFFVVVVGIIILPLCCLTALFLSPILFGLLLFLLLLRCVYIFSGWIQFFVARNVSQVLCIFWHFFTTFSS